MNILGISCFYHDSAVVLVQDGEVVAAVEEERFTREKHDNSFPENAVDYCLKEKKLQIEDIDKVVFYEKPIQKFDRILETAASTFPKGYRLFSEALPKLLNTKLRIRKKLRKIGYNGKVEFVEHHTSHAASAFYPSPFENSAILTIDGVGERKTNQMFYGEKDSVQPLKHIEFPHSLGLLYSTITAFLGFVPNNGEYKVMGLASYGKPIYQKEFNELITINQDGSYSLNPEYFAYTYKRKMWSKKLENLLGEPRSENEKITQRHKNIAATLQNILEEALIKQINELYRITDTENLCMAGGVALNSAANGKIRKEMPFENIWIQPAAGDSGGAMGAALERTNSSNYRMENVYLGPRHSREQIENTLEEKYANYKETTKEELLKETASRISDGEVIALYQGRLEWGPRALGNRSIIADPRKEEMIDIVNQKVKFRESFRPFAPTVLEEKASEYFDIEDQSPYMLFTSEVKKEKQEEIPAVTHVDNTSRIQTLKRETNQFYYDLIKRFYQDFNTPLVLNTSFNLKGMPIVNTPREAYDVFASSGIDTMITPDFIIEE